MKRKPKQKRGEATVQVVLDAAAQVLLRDGYARASTNRIAERAGVSVGSVYQYFGGKDEIMLELLAREIEHLIDTVVTETGGSPGARLQDSLARLLEASVRGWRYEPHLYRELENAPRAELHAMTRDARARLQAHVRETLQCHAAEIRHRDLESASFVLVNAAIGLTSSADERFLRQESTGELLKMFAGYLLIDLEEVAEP